MKKFTLLLLGLLATGSAMAQDDPESFKRYQQQMREAFERERDGMNRQYDEERKKSEAEFAAFRKKANEEYAAEVQQAWEEMGVKPAVPKPKEPKPPRIPAPPVDKLPTSKPLPQERALPSPPEIAPIPMPAIPEPAPEAPTIQFAFYGTTCDVHTDVEELRFTLPSLKETSIAAEWKQLSQKKYDGLLHDCIERREAMRLSDWGYICLLGNMSEKLLGKGSNEAVLLQMYLLAQSGYCVRIGRVNDRLVLLVPFNWNIYNYSYIDLDGIRYYALTKEDFKSVSVCNVSFPREQVANIIMKQLPILDDEKTGISAGKKKSRTLQAERFGTMKATVEVDCRLVDYLNDYPLNDAWACYVQAGLSDDVKSTLYPALQSQIKGKSQKKAAVMLLDFVQTAFDYATDDEQFGYERPLFGDESVFYLKNDCEDRSIFYSILVRDLLGLDVVMVQWPGHMATAVEFSEKVDGDYFVIDGHRYTVCDPTYVGAGIGESMPHLQDVSAQLMKL